MRLWRSRTDKGLAKDEHVDLTDSRIFISGSRAQIEIDATYSYVRVKGQGNQVFVPRESEWLVREEGPTSV